MIQFKGKKIVVFSDTHGMHRQLNYEMADIAIHLGDACCNGNDTQLFDFFDWFGNYPAKHKIFVAGNHELQLELEPDRFLEIIPGNIIFLENNSVVIDDIIFLSIAARPWLHYIPSYDFTDIYFLLTHGPAKGLLDKNLGCTLLKTYVENTHPKFHLLGHIHENGNSRFKMNNTTFINASNYYQLCQ